MITISKSGSTLTTSGTSSAATAIPTNTGGRRQAVRVIATGNAYIKFGNDSVVATTNDILITPTASCFNIAGHTHFAVIQAGTSASINITPIEK